MIRPPAAAAARDGRVNVTVDERLHELGIELPAAPRPLASYVPLVRVGTVLYVSGQIPMSDGKLIQAGRVGADVDIAAAAQLARRCALQALRVLQDELGSLDRIERLVKLSCFVRSASGFSEQPKVANGASDVLVEIFGDAGRHARLAVGVAELPLGAPVELDLLVTAKAALP